MSDWKVRALHATGAHHKDGPQTLTGAVLLAVLGLKPRKPPRFSGLATVTSDGFILCDFQDRHYNVYRQVFVGTVVDVRDNFRRLCDQLQLPQADRDELFSEIMKWVSVDYRAIALRTEQDKDIKI